MSYSAAGVQAAGETGPQAIAPLQLADSLPMYKRMDGQLSTVSAALPYVACAHSPRSCLASSPTGLMSCCRGCHSHSRRLQTPRVTGLR